MLFSTRSGPILSQILIAGLCAQAAHAGHEKPQESGAPEPTVDFIRDVVPALTKAGCNAGTCHGSFQGRGGFRLSLLGFDPAADYEALAKQARGRRISVAAPAHSLLLRKPTGAVPHGGGIVLDETSAVYPILRRWIEGGAREAGIDDLRVERLAVSPVGAVLQPGAARSLSVIATWSDGVTKDVTAWALFDSGDEEVATVSKAGLIEATGRGRTAITVRFMGQVGAVTVTVPYQSIADFPTLVQNNFVDTLVEAEWRTVGVLPAPLCDDATFLRRVSLDLTGTLPTPEEIREFLASKDPGKRAQKIDALLERPEYVDFWALRWSDLLRAHRRFLGEKGLGSFNGWLRGALRTNRPYDELVSELLTARGNLYTSGPVAYFFVDKTPAEVAEATAQIFLGVRMQCARCHHHPFEVWSQEEYYGMAAFFAGVERKDTNENGRYGGSQSIKLASGKTVTHPNTGEVMDPRMLGAAPLEFEPGTDIRENLADWITSPDNPFFAENVVNRYWAYLFGRGLVHPVDDLRQTNPASHPALLEALARDFVAHGYDLKHLLRTLSNARVYQLAAELDPRRDKQGVFLTHDTPRRLPAEVLLDAVNSATGTTETFANLPPGIRAIELPDTAVASEFLDIFGRPKRTTTCTCERGAKPDLRQVLHLTNSEALSQKVAAGDGRVARLLAADQGDEAICQELFLATLSRPPTADEVATALKLLAEAPSRKEGFEDLLWTLINCAEFSFSR